MKSMKIINIIFLYILSLPALSSGVCISNSSGQNACEAAKKLAGDLSLILPLRLDDEVTLVSATYSKNMVSLTSILSYTKMDLEIMVLKRGKNMADLNQLMRKSTVSDICRYNSPTFKFINSGGYFQYIYKFSDGANYLIIDILTCG